MSETMSRRALFRLLPALPVLPALLSRVSTMRLISEQHGTRLANGATRWTYQRYEQLLGGGRRLIEDVEWVTKNGETVAGSTVWKVARGARR